MIYRWITGGHSSLKPEVTRTNVGGNRDDQQNAPPCETVTVSPSFRSSGIDVPPLFYATACNFASSVVERNQTQTGLFSRLLFVPECTSWRSFVTRLHFGTRTVSHSLPSDTRRPSVRNSHKHGDQLELSRFPLGMVWLWESRGRLPKACVAVVQYTPRFGR